MIAWTAIEDAILVWVAAASGLTTIWEGEADASRPAAPYIALSASARQVGQDWVVTADGAGGAGAELDETVRGVRELTLDLRCFGGAKRGPTKPGSVLEDVLQKSRLNAARALLKAGGWAPARFDPVLDTGAVLGGASFENRADARCFGMVSSEVTGTATYIQIVKITNQLTGVETTLDSEA
jgi:hypothetical protein